MHSLSLTLAFIASLLPFSATAQTIVKGIVQRKIEIDSIPSYFFKVHGSGQFLAFTETTNLTNPAAGGENKLLDVQKNITETIPGPWDPVFVGDTNLMVLPRQLDGPLVRYELRRLDDRSYIGEFPDLQGLYQSVGVLSIQNQKITARLIAESAYDTHPVQDFVYDSSSNTLKLTATSQGICPGFSIKLPMLSKDGHFLGGLDLQTNKSAIWEIQSDFTCIKIHDLGIKTGKLNFDSQNSKVTYHIYAQAVQHDPTNPDDQSDHYVAIPSADFVSDIFVMDLKSKKITRITANTDMNSMYPDFTRDGRLVFINHPHSPNKKVSFTFLRF
jgi:hypothetical protein